MATAVSAPDLRELVRRTAIGEADALGRIYELFGTSLYRLAYRLTGNAADAEDVVHDVFVGLPEALARYEERSAFEAWIKRVTARRALMTARARRRRRETGLDATSDVSGAAAPVADRVALEAVVRALAPDLRAVVLLKEVEGYSHSEIGEMLGISAGASRVRLARALKRLRKALEDGR